MLHISNLSPIRCSIIGEHWRIAKTFFMCVWWSCSQNKIKINDDGQARRDTDSVFYRIRP